MIDPAVPSWNSGIFKTFLTKTPQLPLRRFVHSFSIFGFIGACKCMLNTARLVAMF